MDTFEVGGRKYQIVIISDEYGAEISVWLGSDKVAAIVIDDEALSLFNANTCLSIEKARQ